MKKLIWFVLGGALIGSALASWLAPKAIAWYFDPPVNIGLNCRAATEWAMAKLQLVQGFGFAAGGIIGVLLSLVLRKQKGTLDGVPEEPTV